MKCHGTLAFSPAISRRSSDSAVTAPAGIPWRIKRVIPESPAQKAGVKPDDIITHLNGTELTADNVNKLFAQFAFPPQLFEPQTGLPKPLDRTLTFRRGTGRPFDVTIRDTPYTPASAFGVRHLFTGQQWYQEVGLYDLRNRFYSPDLGRFLQPDPIGFKGDRTNLYRYCGNNPVTRWDPFGLEEEYLNNEGWNGNDSPPEYSNFDTGEPWNEGGSEENPSNFGLSEYAPGMDQSDRGLVNVGPPIDNPGGMGGTVPGAIFYGANGGGGGMPSEAGGPEGLGLGKGTSPSGLPGTSRPNGPPTAAPVSMPMSQVIAKMSKYRLEIDPNKIIVPITTQFASEDLVLFGDAIYYGASAYAIGGLGGMGIGEALMATPLGSATVSDTLPYLRFIFQMIAEDEGPPGTPPLPPPPPPYIGGP